MSELIANSTVPKKPAPLVTFAIVAYNQEKYIRDAVEGAFSQTYAPLEIIISDDCSSDNTFEIIKDISSSYTGQSTLKIVRNDKNLGICAHVDSIASLAQGDLLVLAAGDDISEKNRVEKVARAWRHCRASAIYCGATMINEAGDEIGEWDVSILASKGILKVDPDSTLSPPPYYGAGAAYERSLFTRFGPLPADIRNEDFNLAWRAFMSNGVAYVPEKLIRYRKHEENFSFWVKLANARSIRERVRINSASLKNELKNFEHVLEYAVSIYGSDSGVATEIRDLMERKRKSDNQLFLDELRLYCDQILSPVRKVKNNVYKIFRKQRSIKN